MEHLHSIVSRLNELVPVIVRMTPGRGEPTKQDFILWYEPSNELFLADPEDILKSQAGCFVGKTIRSVPFGFHEFQLEKLANKSAEPRDSEHRLQVE